MSDTTTISVTRDTYERLKEVGRYGDSMDQIIRRLLDVEGTEETKQ